MRWILLVGLALLASSSHAQGAEDPAGDDDISLIVRIERAVWASADRVADDFKRTFEVDPTDVLSEQLRRVRQRGYAAGVQAAEAKLLVELLGALRQDRGDAIPLCADELALRRQLDLLVIAGDDLVELDPSRFEEEAFDAAAFQGRMAEVVEPLRELAAAHVSEVQDVCQTVPEPHRHDGP
ncbi:MAG: hypothetical protein AAF170_09550 [Bacteroidota bacterium]